MWLDELEDWQTTRFWHVFDLITLEDSGRCAWWDSSRYDGPGATENQQAKYVNIEQYRTLQCNSESEIVVILDLTGMSAAVISSQFLSTPGAFRWDHPNAWVATCLKISDQGPKVMHGYAVWDLWINIERLFEESSYFIRCMRSDWIPSCWVAEAHDWFNSGSVCFDIFCIVG